MDGDGVYSNLIIIGMAILIISGWFSTLVDKFGTPKKTASLIIIILVMIPFDVSLTNGIIINVGGFILPFIIYFFFWLQMTTPQRIHIFSATILLGASFFLMRELFRLDPILLFWDEKYQIPLFMTILAFIVDTELFRRILLIVGGNLLGELTFSFRNQEVMNEIVLGDGHFRDLLWISIITITTFHYVTQTLKAILKQKIIWKQSIR